LTVPTPYGLGPGNGSLVAALESVTGACPKVAGKPQSTLFLQTAARVGSQRALVIGDRLDTDIDGAIAAGMDSLLVLTGVHQMRDVMERPDHLRPTFIAQDLRCLLAESAPTPSDVIG
jgi:ribonucleotide monophosphatase NagD (HAD superfamily)